MLFVLYRQDKLKNSLRGRMIAEKKIPAAILHTNIIEYSVIFVIFYFGIQPTMASLAGFDHVNSGIISSANKIKIEKILDKYIWR